MTTEAPAPDAGFRLLKANRLRLLTDAAGAVAPDGRGLGLYLGDTRLLCRLELRLGGRPVRLAGGSTAGTTLGLTDEFDLAGGAGPRVLRRRTIGRALVEELRVTPGERSRRPISVRLTIGFDGADIFEIRGYRRRSRGELLPVRVEGSRIRFAYLGRDLRLRSLAVELSLQPTEPIIPAVSRRGREARVRVDWRLAPGPMGAARLGWRIEPSEVEVIDRSMAVALQSGPIPPLARTRPAAPASFVAASIRVDDGTVQRVLDRALDDLFLLGEDGPSPGERIVAAGLPWFAALFGRDALLTGFESIAFRPDLARDALTVLADHQATAGDARRGARPGQVLHELRTGEMARLGEVPFGPSFGTVDATPLWLVLLGETLDWTGDAGLLERLWPNALRAIEWIDGRVDRDPSGFLRYRGRPGALANEGWKDSPDAIRDRAGAIVPPPIALAEVQGYLYDAWRRLARLASIQGDAALAARLAGRARDLRARFNAEFRVADRAAMAMAMGGDGRVADAIASNVGQCLGAGILDSANAADVARRLLGPDMDSGWGIRTLSALEPAYEPDGYHTGSVWPHDTALITGGLKQAGFDEAAVGLADRLLEAAAALPDARLPELISGEPRLAGRPPGSIERACRIQAWASAAPLHLVRSLLGLEPDAALGRLTLERPTLPSAVGLMRIEGLLVGPSRLDLEIRRMAGGLVVRPTTGGHPIQVVVRRG